MIVEDKNEIGIDQALFDKVKDSYLSKQDVKKIDIGGGLIHGNARDFRSDESNSIILAHFIERVNHRG